MLNILYISNDRGFCKFYRILFPAEHIRQNLLANVALLNTDDRDVIIRECSKADVIVFQHGTTGDFIIDVAEMIKEKKLPQLLVCEYDDDLPNVSPLNPPAYMKFGVVEHTTDDGKPIYKDGVDDFDLKENIERVERMKKINSSVDLITVTTPELKETFSYCDTPIEILPNLINPSVMPPKTGTPKLDGKIRIVWQGGDSHFEDLILVMPALKKLKDYYGNMIEFYFMGMQYKTPCEIVDAVQIPWCEAELFYPNFSEQHFDIGIIPIADNDFNKCKSNIKWLEYTFYDIPSVVQNNLPYNRYIEDGVDGLLFDDNLGLFNAIKKLIEDPAERRRIAFNAKRKVLTDFNIEHNDKFKNWIKVYEKHLKNKINSYKT